MSAMPLTCAQCGNVMMDDSAFCRKCGGKRPGASGSMTDLGGMVSPALTYSGYPPQTSPRPSSSFTYSAPPPMSTTYTVPPPPNAVSYAAPPSTRTVHVGSPVPIAALPTPVTSRMTSVMPVARQVVVQQPPQPQTITLVKQQPMVSHVPNFDPAILELQAQVAELQQALHIESRARQSCEIGLISLKQSYSELSVSVSNAVNISMTKYEAKLGPEFLQQYEFEKNQMSAKIEAVQRSSNSLVLENNQLKEALQAESEARVNLEGVVAGLQEEIENLKAHLSEFDFFSTNDLQKNLHTIESRGNVQVDFEKGEIRLVNPITFVPRTTRDEPTAEFNRPDVADNICQDLAEVMNLFNCPAKIEGHTKGGESEFWQTLADDRAHVVVEKIIEHGGDASKMSSEGKPGKRGLNETKTVVRLEVSAEMKTNIKRSSVSNMSGIIQ